MVKRRSPEQSETAKRLLAREGAGPSAAQCASAAVRVYDKLLAHLGPLLGVAGVEALLARSAKLTAPEFSFLEGFTLQGSTSLPERLQAQEAAVASAAAEAFFGNFFALMASFIGERLTTQILRRAWPAIDETAATEKAT